MNKKWQIWLTIRWEDGTETEDLIESYRTKTAAKWHEAWFNWPRVIMAIAYHNSHPSTGDSRILGAISEIRKA